MIRIDAVWLATEPLDMRSGFDSCLARVIKVFGASHPHNAYLFANRRANRLNAEQLRKLAAELITRIAEQSKAIAAKDSDILYRQAKIDKLTHELVTLKRWKFGRSSELLNASQTSWLDETLDADIAAIELELKALSPAAKAPALPREQPKRAALPAGLPRVEIHHEPDSTTCHCGCQLKRIGQDVSEKLDYTPGVFTVEEHIRGKWVCDECETLTQAPVPAQIIDKGIPTAGLLAQVLVANSMTLSARSRCSAAMNV